MSRHRSLRSLDRYVNPSNEAIARLTDRHDPNRRARRQPAMQCFVVVPLFAGFDVRWGVDRLFEDDVTGGRYEESDVRDRQRERRRVEGQGRGHLGAVGFGSGAAAVDAAARSPTICTRRGRSGPHPPAGCDC